MLIQTLQRVGPLTLATLSEYLSDPKILDNPKVLMNFTSLTSPTVWQNKTVQLDSDVESLKSITLHHPKVMDILRIWIMDSVYDSGERTHKRLHSALHLTDEPSRRTLRRLPVVVPSPCACLLLLLTLLHGFVSAV